MWIKVFLGEMFIYYIVMGFDVEFSLVMCKVILVMLDFFKECYGFDIFDGIVFSSIGIDFEVI